MKHLEALRVLPRYFEGALDRETTRAFHEHLKHCSDCRDQIRQMRSFAQRRSGDAPRQEGRRRSRLVRNKKINLRITSSLNAHHLAASRAAQRRFAIQFLLAAGLFFLAVRFGVFHYLMGQ